MAELAAQSESATIATAGARRATVGERLGAGVMALGCLAVLVVAANLTPSEAGHGTHTSMGFPECSWVVMFDKPCMTCGMTTAFSNAAHGRWTEAFLAQPAGLVLCLIAATAFWLALHVVVFGSALGGLTGRVLQPRVLWTGAAVFLAAWMYKWLTWPISPV